MQKTLFLVLGEGDTSGIHGSFGTPKEKFSSDFSQAKTKFCLIFHYNGDNSYLFVNRKGIYSFKVTIINY